ncbi:serine/threonine kinase [Xylaria sp. FL1042]|nr:serine/threonine kinase [Xylaria sp. FL1042]
MEVIQTSQTFVQREEGLRVSSPSATDLEELELVEIPTDHIWPIFYPGLTAAAQPLTPDTYIKTPSLIDYGDTPASYKLSDHISNEVEVCEMLMKHPHPNIAHYLGCIVEYDRIIGLCFVKYDMNLSEALRRNIPFDKERCLRGIENGISHLHGKEGQELGLKRGTVGWCAEKMDYATRDNDRHGISKIREFLVKGNADSSDFGEKRQALCT